MTAVPAPAVSVPDRDLPTPPPVAEPDEVARRHAFHPLRVKRIVEETADTRSFVLDVPPDLAPTYSYRPGQFCTFRVPTRR